MSVKISVIIPAYNVENYVEECLESLLKQSVSEYEIICVDDSSSDNTYEILCEYSNRHRNITCVHNIENKGAAYSRNIGLGLAKGEYVIFLDSDDTYHPRLLEKLYIAASSEKADVAVCNVNYYNAGGEVILQSGWNRELLKKNVLTNYDNRENIFEGILISPWNKLVKKNFLIENKIQFQNLKTSNDVFYSMMVVACAEKIISVPEVLVYYRHERPGNITQHKKQKRDYLVSAYEEVIKQLKKKGLWKKDIQKAGITAIIRRCYSLVTTSKSEITEYYVNEWKTKLVPILLDEEVEQIGDNWLYYQYLFLSGRTLFYESEYHLMCKEIGEYLQRHASETIVLWGAGKKGKDFLSAIANVENYVNYIVDNDMNKQGNFLQGIEICSYEKVKGKVDKYLVLNEKFMEDIKMQVEEPTKLVNMTKIMEQFKKEY
uniref:glycosyltransferase family 2 protein n=1 Tax=Acetatifactor sp. TaxID=1872090 RepID=UPI0040576FD2